jgi:hypothetical protein
VFGGASLKAPVSFFLRIPPSSLISLEKKGKEKRAKTETIETPNPRNP